jgi:hypothetical protein
MVPLGETRTWIWGQTLSDRTARGITRFILLAVALNPIYHDCFRCLSCPFSLAVAPQRTLSSLHQLYTCCLNVCHETSRNPTTYRYDDKPLRTPTAATRVDRPRPGAGGSRNKGCRPPSVPHEQFAKPLGKLRGYAGTIVTKVNLAWSHAFKGNLTASCREREGTRSRCSPTQKHECLPK